MKDITVSLITNQKDEINRFLSTYYQREMDIKNETFKWSMICNSPFECLNIVTTAIDNNDKYNMQVHISMPELEAVIDDNNVNDFVKYIYCKNM